MEIKKYIESHFDELKQLLCDMVQIPAPSYHEKERALFIKNWLESAGYKNQVTVDEVYNVIVDPTNTQESFDLVMAHIDTVFQDINTIKVKEDSTYLYAPGIGDDGANAAILLLILKYAKTYHLDISNYVFVFNVCEEGLGNLNGSKHIYHMYQKRIKTMISFDCYYNEIFMKSVGSVRYDISIQTKGGHSYFDFPNKNAIVEASSLIQKLYQLDYQPQSKTTYNVGVIEGGTSVNTIAQSAHFLFEIRSNDDFDLTSMQHLVESLLNASDEEISISYKIIGERPCMKDVNEQALLQLCTKAKAAIQSEYNGPLTITSGSTDCNWFLNKGIPSICFGLCMGEGMHTLEEKIETLSLKAGFIIAYNYLFNNN